MDRWQEDFLKKLKKAQSQYSRQFEKALEECVGPTFNEMNEFLRSNGFTLSQPLKEDGRRSFKFELSENAYLLMIFRFGGVGDFELRREMFVPGCEPMLEKSTERVADVDRDWAARRFRRGLDEFVEKLNNPAGDGNAAKSREAVEELVTV